MVGGPGADVTGNGSQSDPFVVGLAAPPGGGGSSDRLLGEVIAYAGAAPPDSTWLMCNGQAVSRSAYGPLFAVLGTFYGAGDGTTTFNVPDLRDRSPMGASGTNARGTALGADTATLDVAHLPAHHHPMSHGHTTASAGVHDHQLQRSNSTGSGGATIPKGGSLDVTSALAIANDGAHVHTVNNFTGNTGDTGSATPVPTRTPSVALNFLIKAVA